MKKSIIPVIIFDAYSLSANFDAISDAPLLRKIISKVMATMKNVLNLASQATMIAVKPRPPAVLVEIVWSTPATPTNPASPHTAPDIIIVRIITFLTLIPAYLAVFLDSQTTAISYHCFVFLRFTNIATVAITAMIILSAYFCPNQVGNHPVCVA